MDDLCAGVFEHVLALVRRGPAEAVLEEFRALFVDGIGAAGTEPLNALYQIAFRDREDLYHHILRRCCYIAINNWMASRQEAPVRQLVALLEDSRPGTTPTTTSPSLERLHRWRSNFLDSEDYEHLRLFVIDHEIQLPGAVPTAATPANPRSTPPSTQPWNRRFAAHLLLDLATDPTLDEEERRALRDRAQQLRDRFKFDLALYAVRSQSGRNQGTVQNPTSLGDGALQVVKVVVRSMRRHGYASAANLFRTQTRGLTYSGYKRSLKKYLTFAVTDMHSQPYERLCAAIDGLYCDREGDTLTDGLHLQTCQRTIALLTTENAREPSRLFLLLLSGGHGLTLVLLLLKVVILCPSARPYLDLCIAKLLRHYEALDEDQCRWVIHFFEAFNVAFAIHSDTIRFDLVPCDRHPRDRDDATGSLDRYRVFSQISSPMLADFIAPSGGQQTDEHRRTDDRRSPSPSTSP